ncbi:unnamed protein product [Vitrella brassicaformis CCMP3155]|uniref:Uncharacterized protein n=1 Tax=Vitrella brassicaformis (strain CCMP3155) TaxID=1169540 RepID=A0A0G4FDJ7_VITBC|nr:unnamed protein product [Vitrella brassicaformis CCMP3155]|eukprot:CEM10987.1 unnamed protein product [Vitrella brassicaformis CCMP3155]
MGVVVGCSRPTSFSRVNRLWYEFGRFWCAMRRRGVLDLVIWSWYSWCRQVWSLTHPHVPGSLASRRVQGMTRPRRHRASHLPCGSHTGGPLFRLTAQRPRC